MSIGARPYIWKYADTSTRRGAYVNGPDRLKKHAFIPEEYLRKIADQLHDIADEYEQETTE